MDDDAVLSSKLRGAYFGVSSSSSLSNSSNDTIRSRLLLMLPPSSQGACSLPPRTFSSSFQEV